MLPLISIGIVRSLLIMGQKKQAWDIFVLWLIYFTVYYRARG